MSKGEQPISSLKEFPVPEENMWEEYIQLATDYKPINLGMGFPDFLPPKYMSNGLVEVVKENDPTMHQYTRGLGHPRLIKALSKLYSPLVGKEIDPYNEILISVGAYGALYCAIAGHISAGDEVVLFEPAFDCYEPMIRMVGAVPKFVPFKFKPTGNSTSTDWIFDVVELQKAFNSTTKAIILNTPHNPLGKVFTKQELQVIADVCRMRNLICISDEVYEWMVFEPSKHVRIASLPGMWERTITIGSAGKAFCITGWKIGWAYGPAYLIKNLHTLHSNSTYTCSTILQEVIARGMEFELSRFNTADCYFTSLAKGLTKKRDFMLNVLKNAGFKPIVPDGGYFMVCDWSSLESQIDLSNEVDTYRDFKFTKWMTKNIGIQTIPMTPFFSDANKSSAEHLFRLCFIKEDEKLKAVAEILKRWRLNEK